MEPKLVKITMRARRSRLLDESYSEVGLYFGPEARKGAFKKVFLCPFHCKPRPSVVSFESPGLENIPQVPGNGPEVGENYDARKAVLASLSVLK